MSLWYHGAGNPTEGEISGTVISDFNASQSDWTVKLEQFPQGAYNDTIVAAAVAGNLPDIIDVDGPNMPNWARAGYMAPLELSEGTLDGFLPGTIGTGRTRSTRSACGTLPLPCSRANPCSKKMASASRRSNNHWAREEFDAAPATLKATGKFEFPLDLSMDDRGEWYPYAFSPFLQSFGGDIMDRTTYTTAEGALNGDAAIALGEWWQSLFTNQYAPGTSQTAADHATGFIDGRYALQWNGVWNALPAIEAFGDDLLFLPAPDFGNGPKIGAGSRQFGVSATSAHKDGASAFIEFATRDKYVAAFSNGLGLIPATASAAELTENYKPGGPLAVFYDLSKARGTLRPVTPGYVVAALEFIKLAADIANGADVADTLDAATDAINADIQRNNNYGF
ncbi:extracellular solute-binding protein [Devosia sp. A8/3-2]|nr:extracellular solute-binding protein [Devosia sp. A8/3-2]